MDREQALQEVKNRYADYLRPAKKRGTYICPLCGNGSGSTGDGLSIIPKSKGGNGTTLKCFKCGESGSIIDFYMKEHGLSEPGDAIKALYELFNITIDTPTSPNKPIKADKGINTPLEAEKGTETPQSDYTEYYKACKGNINNPAAQEYLSLRGISQATAAKYWLGFDSTADPASAPGALSGNKPHPCPRIIIPFDASHYMGRSIDPNTEKQYIKLNNKGDGIGIFNLAALNSNKPVFIVEGAFDALSVIEVGGEAVSINSTSNVSKLLSILDAERPTAPLIICLDNDEQGQKSAADLTEGLQQRGIPFITADICPGCKDANELLTKDRQALADAVRKAEQSTADATKPYNTKSYILEAMQGEIEHLKEQSHRKTGFSNLDAEINSLYAGLYCVGAISSLGKTTFVYQLCDQLAEQGDHVLYFSLEQSRLELVSKSISRLTAKADYKSAVSSIQIRTGAKGANISDATSKYLESVSDRVSIIEGNYECTASFISDTARAYRMQNKATPVIVVDYLQVMTPEQQRADTRANIDSNLVALKRLSRELETPIIVICSINRTNYLTPIDFEAFKESGAIEFTADVVWGLQLSCMHDEIFNKEGKIKEKREKVAQAKAAIPRDIELVCLKNRFGKSRYSVAFQYFPQYDYFVPVNDGFAEDVTGIELPFKDAKTI